MIPLSAGPSPAWQHANVSLLQLVEASSSSAPRNAALCCRGPSVPPRGCGQDRHSLMLPLSGPQGALVVPHPDSSGLMGRTQMPPASCHHTSFSLLWQEAGIFPQGPLPAGNSVWVLRVPLWKPHGYIETSVEVPDKHLLSSLGPLAVSG